MSNSIAKRLGMIALAGTVLGGMPTEAFAERAGKTYNRGHYGSNYRQHYGNNYRRQYGNPAVGAAVAGTALGIIGLAAGAAASNRYDDGYGYGYGAPGYYGAGPGYETEGYDPF